MSKIIKFINFSIDQLKKKIDMFKNDDPECYKFLLKVKDAKEIK